MNKDQFELTKNKSKKSFRKLFLILLLIFSTLSFIYKDPFTIGFTCFIILSGILFFIDNLNKSPILLVDENGIWVKRKNKKISWNRIVSFSTIEIYDYEGAHSQNINFHLKRETVKVVYIFADQTIDEVRKAILNYSSEYNIKDKGHHKEGF
jgi:hypothetical protein